MYIKDLQTGKVRMYGYDHHDSLIVSDDGRTLSYYHLQCGDGSRYGDFRFTDEEGIIPSESDIHLKYGANLYFNIGGFATYHNINEKPLWEENREVLILTKYGKTIIGEWNARTQTFMSEGMREEDFDLWQELPEWRKIHE